MKRLPMAVLISLSREGLICSVTRALKWDKMYLAQKAHQKDEGGRLRVSEKTRNKIVVFLS